MAAPECRKFAPNIFNKSKCSNCFRLKEDHSASAIELNKASRKISKCGYLFVAPDWDFANPVNRCGWLEIRTSVVAVRSFLHLV